MLCLLAAVLMNPNPYELHRFDGQIHHAPRDSYVAETVGRLSDQEAMG